jgi:hypothetical protein
MIFQGRSFWYALRRCLHHLCVCVCVCERERERERETGEGGNYHVEEEHVKVLKSDVGHCHAGI